MECSNNSMNKYFWGENSRSGKKQAKLHSSIGWTSISWPNDLPSFFEHTGHITQKKKEKRKKPFQK